MSTLCKEDFDFDEIIKLYEEKVRPLYPTLPEHLKREQAESIHASLVKKDLLCILPTGYGKTLCMLVFNSTSITLIVSPLIALMEDMVHRLSQAGLKAKCFTPKDLTEGKPIQEEYLNEPYYILMSPESLKTKQAKEFVKSSAIHLVAIDERHTTFEWGKTFRKDYACIYEVRSFVECPLAVYTATVTPEILNSIKKLTGLDSRNLHTIALTPDGRNIYLNLIKTGLNLSNLAELVEDMKTKKAEAKKTVIFVNTIAKATTVFNWFHEQLQELGIHEVYNVPVGFTVDMYSSCIEDEAKKYIMNEFRKTNSHIRILVATLAFGMGIDIPDIRKVIIWGQPKSPMILWQQIGRAARDGKAGEACIYPGGVPKTSVKQSSLVLPNDKCLRSFILDQFYGKKVAVIENVSTYTETEHDYVCKMCSCCSCCRKTCSDKREPSKRSGTTKLLSVIAPKELIRKKK